MSKKNSLQSNQFSNSLTLISTLKLKTVQSFQKKLLQNKHLQHAIKSCLTQQMSSVFSLFYFPYDVEMKISSNGVVIIQFKSQLFVFQQVQDWFQKKQTDLKDKWHKWNGVISYGDLYFIGRFYDSDLQTLTDLNMELTIDIVDKSNQFKKTIELKQRKISFQQEFSQIARLISPNFELSKYKVQQTNTKKQQHSKTNEYNIYLLTEQNDLWMDDLVRIDVHYQLPIEKLAYQSFNMLHFLEHCLLAFKQQDIEKFKLKTPNGSTTGWGSMAITVVLPLMYLEQFVDMFVKRQKKMYSKLEAERIVQEMYQVGEYEECLQGLGFFHNNDFLKQNYDWNNILYDLLSQLQIVQVFVQLSTKQQPNIKNVLQIIKHMLKLPSQRDNHIKKYFESYGQFNKLPIFKYRTLIKLKQKILKIENLNVVPYVIAQDSDNIYLLKEQFDYLDDTLDQTLIVNTEDIFNPYNRFFDFANTQLMWIQYNKENIDRIQYQQSLKNICDKDVGY